VPRQRRGVEPGAAAEGPAGAGGLAFASFNQSAGSLDSAVSPAGDWAD